MTPKELMQSAIQHGACMKSGKATGWKSLSWLLFSPQGREFCESEAFPSIDDWREIAKSADMTELPIYVDAGRMEIANVGKTAAIGGTIVEASYSGTDRLYKLILMHGAQAHVRASNYAVVMVVTIGDGCKVDFDNDKTAKII